MASLLSTLVDHDDKAPGATMGLSGLAKVTGRTEDSLAEELRRFEARGWVRIFGNIGSPRGVFAFKLTAEGRQAALDARTGRRVVGWFAKRLEATASAWVERGLFFLLGLGGFWLYQQFF